MKNILMAIESCESTTVRSPIVEKTIELASALSCKVWIVHVVPSIKQLPYNVDSKISRHEVAAEYRQEHEFIQYLAKCMQVKDIDASALLLEGPVISTLLNESERLEIDLIVLGCQKHSRLYSAVMDDTDEGMLSKCSYPIMFIPDKKI